MKNFVYVFALLFMLLGIFCGVDASNYVKTLSGVIVTGQDSVAYGVLQFDDGSGNVFKLLDRNLGALMTGAGSNAPEESYGYYYQWGNNYGFPITGTIQNVKHYQSVNIDASSYGPENYYNSDMFIIGNGDWSIVPNLNLWGGGEDSQINIWGLSGITSETLNARQGPCPVGYHVPSIGERNNIFVYWYNVVKNENILTGTLQSRTQTNLGKDFAADFLIPFEGFRNYSTSSLDQLRTRGRLWSSSATGFGPYSSYLFVDGNNMVKMENGSRAYGWAVRCLSNDYLFKIKFYNGDNNVGLLLVNNGNHINDQDVLDITSNMILNSQMTGKEFSGWFYDKEFVNSFDTGVVVTGDSSLYAKRNTGIYTITFMDSENIIGLITGDYDSEIILPDEPYKTGYKFIGRDKEIPNRMPSYNITVSAIWKKEVTENQKWGGSGGGGRGGKKLNAESSGMLLNESNIYLSGDMNIFNSIDESKILNSSLELQESEFEVYKWAYEKGLIQDKNQEEAKLDSPITRGEMAKISTIFTLDYFDKFPDVTKEDICSNYIDINLLTGDTLNYIVKSCQLGNMGYKYDGQDLLDDFAAYENLPVAQAAIVVSRMLWGNKNVISEDKWYQGHIYAAYESQLIDNIVDPFRNVTKLEVLTMLYRLDKMLIK